MYIWDELTAVEFQEAIKETKQTCIIPFGCIEKHGTHLPLGTDMMVMKKVLMEVAKLEPVMIFPDQPFGQIAEAKHVPGTIALSPVLLYQLMDELCKEISRNGFKKIVFFNAHGGNYSFIQFFIRTSLYEKKDYVIYSIDCVPKDNEIDEVKAILKTDDMGDHAGNLETSMMMVTRPELVKMDRVDMEGIKNLGRLKNLEGAYNLVRWYGDHPTHFAGDPFSSNGEAGQKAVDLTVNRAARLIKAIKDDQIALELTEEFFSKCEGLLKD